MVRDRDLQEAFDHSRESLSDLIRLLEIGRSRLALSSEDMARLAQAKMAAERAGQILDQLGRILDEGEGE